MVVFVDRDCVVDKAIKRLRMGKGDSSSSADVEGRYIVDWLR